MSAPDNGDLAYIALLGAVITGVFTIAGVYIANLSNRKQLKIQLSHEDERLNKNIRRERVEELYTLFEKWSGVVVIHHTTLRKVMDGFISYNQGLDIQIDRELDFDAKRMFTLAELYFEKGHSKLDQIKNILVEASKVQYEFKELYRATGSSSKKHADEITEILDRFCAVVSDYKTILATYVNEV